MDKGPPFVANRHSNGNDNDADEDCCAPTGKQRPLWKKENQELMTRLDSVIKARHVQLGGYSHDEHEHLLEARRLLAQGHDSQARLEVALALEKRALHTRESAKYRNLVALRQTLHEAKRNLTLAELMKSGSVELQNALAQIDPTLLPQRSQNANSVSQPLLMRDEEEEAIAKATEEQVAAELALLRLPPTPTSPTEVAAAPQAQNQKVRLLVE